MAWWTRLLSAALGVVCLVTVSLTEARPGQAWAFTCAPGTFGILDVWLFLDHATIGFTQTCTGGPTQDPWPVIDDAAGNVWWIWLWVDTFDLSTDDERYCILEFSSTPADGRCGGRVQYLLSIPDVAGGM